MASRQCHDLVHERLVGRLARSGVVLEADAHVAAAHGPGLVSPSSQARFAGRSSPQMSIS